MNIFRKDLIEEESMFCILEGESIVAEEVVEFYEEIGREKVYIIRDLYKFPDHLEEIIQFENLVLYTSGVYEKELQVLMQKFNEIIQENRGYTPLRVFFLQDSIPGIFSSMIEKLSVKKGTKFYTMNFSGEIFYQRGGEK
jgi:hypothetical protein